MSIRFSKPHLNEVKRIANPGGDRIRSIRLDKNERTTPFPKEFWQELVSELDPEWMTVYPEVGTLIDAIAAFDGVRSNQVFLTAGSDVAIKACYESFVSPGDEVVYLAPTFAMVDVYNRLFRASAKPVQTRDEFKVDLQELVSAITDQTRFVYLANPNSPSGSQFTLEELEKVVARAHQVGAAMLVDEAYFWFSEVTVAPLISKYDNVLATRTFSKAWGAAGIRLGYILGQAALVDFVSKWRPMYEVNALAVHAGKKLLSKPELMRSYVKEVNDAKEQIYRWAEKNGISFYRSGANFVNVRLGKANVDRVAAQCEAEKILVKNAGGGFGQECLRISAGTPSQIEKVIRIMQQAIGKRE